MKTKTTRHYLKCEAPICADLQAYDPKHNPGHENWKEDVIWYPGEIVCRKPPYTKWQRRQLTINKWHEQGLFKRPELYWNVNMLMNRTKIMKGSRGGNPEVKSYSKH